MKDYHARVDEQIHQAKEKFGLPPARLKFATDTFKPDSPKLETVVAVEIGSKDNKSKYVRSVCYFYSPRKYRFTSISKLKGDIERYLKIQRLKKF